MSREKRNFALASKASRARGSFCQHDRAYQSNAGTTSRREAGTRDSWPVSPIVEDALSSTDQSLHPEIREMMESRFGHDFRNVRIHSNGVAAEAAHSLSARAFAAQNHIVFGTGQYAPESPKGQWLLAHELAHVAQGNLAGTTYGDVERDARLAATAVAEGHQARTRSGHDGRSIHLFGEPENVPEMTYISNQGSAGFLQQAADFHTAWGLTIQRVSSIEQMVRHLAQATTPLNRIRFVTHAADIGVFTSLFTGEPLLSLQRERLSAYAESDAAGLALDTRMNLNFNLVPIIAEIRSTNAAVLQPFGLQASGSPTGSLDDLFRRVLQRVALTRSRTAQNAARFDPLINALPLVLDLVSSQVVQQFAPAAASGATGTQPTAPAVTLQNVQDLRSAIEAAVTSLSMTFTGINIPADQASQVREALRASTTGFRGALNTARARFGAQSWVDIRGCNAGDDINYLHAVSRFFGSGTVLPHASAPNWFQIFPILGLRSFASDAAINGIAGDPNVSEAVNRWSPLTGARDQMELLRSFYSLEIARRQEFARESEPSGSASLLAPTPRLSLMTPINPLISGLPTTSEDRSTVDLLLFRLLPRLDLHEPSLFTSRFGHPRFPGGGLRFAEPGEAIAQSARDRLNRPNAELHYYLNSALVLPVFRGPNQQNFQMFVKTELQNEAIDNWLGSQWSTAAPGLAGLQAGPSGAADTRRVQALVETHDADAQPGAQMLFPPDPRFWQHIIHN